MHKSVWINDTKIIKQERLLSFPMSFIERQFIDVFFMYHNLSTYLHRIFYSMLYTGFTLILTIPSWCTYFNVCILWQYGLWSFQTGGAKLEIFLPKNQHTQRKLLNFENWVNGKVSKSAKIWLSKSIFYVKNDPDLSQSYVISQHELWYV